MLLWGKFDRHASRCEVFCELEKSVIGSPPPPIATTLESSRARGQRENGTRLLFQYFHFPEIDNLSLRWSLTHFYKKKCLFDPQTQIVAKNRKPRTKVVTKCNFWISAI